MPDLQGYFLFQRLILGNKNGTTRNQKFNQNYGEMEALKGINLSVEKGEVVVILGLWQKHLFALHKRLGGD